MAASLDSLKAPGPFYNFILVVVIYLDVGSLASLISTVGFPIACVIAMFYMWNSERESHVAEMKEISMAIQNNTLAINTLTERLAKND